MVGVVAAGLKFNAIPHKVLHVRQQLVYVKPRILVLRMGTLCRPIPVVGHVMADNLHVKGVKVESAELFLVAQLVLTRELVQMVRQH